VVIDWNPEAYKRFNEQRSRPLVDLLELLPPLRELRHVARHIALAVSRQAQADGVAPLITDHDLAERIAINQWEPRYDA
jgi:malic enzyme